MEMKQIAVILLVLAAVAASVYVLTLPQEVPPENGNGGEVAEVEYSPPFEEGTNTTLNVFASNLLSAQNVYIVEDLRGLGEKYPLSRNSIMQCGVDYAGSPGIVGKTLTVYIFEGDICTNYNGESTIGECYADVLEAAGRTDTAVIWIEKGESPEFYSRGLIVRVNEEYVRGTCSINVVRPEQEKELLPGPQANNTGEAEPQPSDEEAPEEPAVEDDSGPGDSHTFP